MCLNVKRKRYTFLSMCTYCNIVTKYSSQMKSHVQTAHGIRSQKGHVTAVPIRINSQFEKCIKRSLDRQPLKTLFKNKGRNELPEVYMETAIDENLFSDKRRSKEHTACESLVSKYGSNDLERPVRKRKLPKRFTEGADVSFTKKPKPEQTARAKAKDGKEMPHDSGSVKYIKTLKKETGNEKNTTGKGSSITSKISSDTYTKKMSDDSGKNLETSLDDDEDDDEIGDSDDDYNPEEDDEIDESEENGENIKSGKFSCEYCQKDSFQTVSQLQKHVSLKHKPKFRNQKSVFSKAFVEYNKQKGKKSSDVSEANEFTRFKCPYCSFYLHHRDYVKSHVLKYHSEVKNFKTSDIVKEVLKVNLGEIAEETDTFLCPNISCEYMSNVKSKVREHCKSCKHGKVSKPKVDCLLPKVWLDKLEKSLMLKCLYCSDCVQGKAEFEDHVKRHVPSKEFKLQLETTLPEVESTDKKQKLLECSICPYCEFSASQKVNVIRHMKRFHSNLEKTAVIQCVLLDGDEKSATAKLFIRDSEETNCSQNPDRKLEVKSIAILSAVEDGKHSCPICDDFRTERKREIVSHMTDNHAKSHPDTDALYFIPSSFTEIKYRDTVKKTNIYIKCSFCDFTSGMLTQVFRHLLDTHEDRVSLESSDANVQAKLTSDTGSVPLMRMESCTVDLKKGELFERMKYRCRCCKPVHNMRTKKGLILHLNTNHPDQDTVEIYDTLYRMVDLLTNNSCTASEVNVCCLCSFRTPSRSEFVQHCNTVHPDQAREFENQMTAYPVVNSVPGAEQTVCEVCHKKFTDSQSLRQHLIFHISRQKWQCSYCNVHFTNSAELESHNIEAHSISGNMCHICGTMFESVSALARHENTHKQRPKERRELCQHCGTSVLSSSLRKHIADMHIEKVSCICEICSSQRVPEDMQAFACEICGKIFCHKYVRKAHMYKYHFEHYRTGPYKCDRCSATFSNRKMQLVHNHSCEKSTGNTTKEQESEGQTNVIHEVSKYMHENHLMPGYSSLNDAVYFEKHREAPFVCAICQKCFRSNKKAKEHVKRTHSAEESRKFQCKTCGKRFAIRSEYVSHCRIHNEDRKFSCKACGKRFKSAHHLKEHMALHSTSADKLHSCRICGKSFRQRGALVAHVGYHDKLKPFKCIFCNKGFTMVSELQRHMNRYFKDLTNKVRDLRYCHVCNKEFQTSYLLQKHFETHIPFNPFQCSMCNDRFGSYRHMYTHKVKKNHFLDSELEEGRQDALSNNRRFSKTSDTVQDLSVTKPDESTDALSAIVESPRSVSAGIGESELDSYTESVIEVRTSRSDQFSEENCHTTSYRESSYKSLLSSRTKFPATLPTQNSQSFSAAGLGIAKQVSGNKFHLNQYSQQNVAPLQEVYLPSGSRHYLELGSSRLASSDTNPVAASDYTSLVLQSDVDNAGDLQRFETVDGSVVHICVVQPKQ